ncbi:transposase [Streptomyces sp. NPDC005151]
MTRIGTYGRQIHEAWQARELLRDLLRLTAEHAHVTAGRSAISAARYRFHSFCADRPHLPELITLAETADQWWDGIEAYVATGITNAASEATTALSGSKPATSSASATEPTNDYGHAARPSGGVADSRSPAAFEDPQKYLRVEGRHPGAPRPGTPVSG